MHAGQLPGYPASHGCVRLPADFAEKLYGVTTVRTTVIIVDHKSAPTYSVRPGFVFARASDSAAPSAGSYTWTPEKSSVGPISIVVSAADHAGYVYRNGVEIGRVSFSGNLAVKGAHVYSALATVDAEGRREWISTANVGGRGPVLRGLAAQLGVPAEFVEHVRSLVTPGTTLVLTAAPVSSRTQSRPGFKILSSEPLREPKR
jgi:hypothetical protein